MKKAIYIYWQNRDINDIDGEIWKFIEETNDRYSVSNYGRVKSNRVLNSINGNSIFDVFPFILKQYLNKTGLLMVCVKYLDKSYHKLVSYIVCKAFNPNPCNLKNVCKILDIKTYNVPSNLTWEGKRKVKSVPISNIEKDYNIVNIIKPDNSIFNIKKSIKGKSFIYGITDENNKIVYVGKSSKPIQRFRQHKTWARNTKMSKQFNLQWLNDILNKGIPEMIILKVVDCYDWEYWEKYYISYYKSQGNTLHNISVGGYSISPKADKVFRSANELRKIPILQCDLAGNIIKEWESTGLASTTLNIKKQNITRCLKGRRPTSYGFKWKYKSI